MRWEVIDLKAGDYVRLLKSLESSDHMLCTAGTVGQIVEEAWVRNGDDGLKSVFVIHVKGLRGSTYVDADPDDLEPVPDPKITTLHTEAGRWEVQDIMTVQLPPDNHTYCFNFGSGTYWVEGKEEGLVTATNPSYFRRRGPGDWQFTHNHNADTNDWARFEGTDIRILEPAYRKHRGITSSLRWEVEPEDIKTGDRVRVKLTKETYPWVLSGFRFGRYSIQIAIERTASLFGAIGIVMGPDIGSKKWVVEFPGGTLAASMGHWYVPESFLELVERP